MSDVKKVVLITGSTAGIGLSCAHALAKRGVNVIVTGSRDATAVSGTLRDLNKYGVQVDYVSADLSKLLDIESLWTKVTALYPDGIDILINNAGVGTTSLVEDVSDAQWYWQIAVNLSAPFHLTKRCLPAMKKKGWGRIINMSSGYGLVAAPNAAVYAATKHGLHGLTKGVALENASHGITCNAVCPGPVLTQMFDTFCEKKATSLGLSPEDFKATVVQGAPTNKATDANQVAELVEFLCLSNASSQITGATYVIDGGLTAQ